MGVAIVVAWFAGLLFDVLTDGDYDRDGWS